MSKKSHSADSFFTLSLMAVAVTLVVTGALSVQAKRYEVAVSTIHAPKATNFELFDINAFRESRRNRNAARVNDLPAATVTEADSASSVSSDASSVDTESSASSLSSVPTSLKPYRLGDLTYSERITLAHQLRVHVCPSPESNSVESEDAIRYRLLCERLLSMRTRETRVGPKNSSQE